ncbi:MAG: hypothetical protein HYR62_07540 [Actinobacteria bacterium]|nr:hypothetical protein [Actinomycetota bacterium]MBI3686170.1 hypothetical protein [Actinomycetota bacterium]
MHVLPAVVPEGESPRSDVVSVRLARKVAVLFGVPWLGGPFDRTWVCDFGALTLAEIARGAPLPSREEQARMDGAAGEAPPAGWRWAGRGVWTPQRSPAPGVVANATLNRFGPDTKAAVVLTGANRLLREATDAVGAVSRWLATSGADPQVRLATWAGVVLEVFRAQPALVVAAVQARSVQRSLTARWGDSVATSAVVGEVARCELGARAAPIGEDDAAAGGVGRVGGYQPVGFDLVDATLPLLDLTIADAAGDGSDRFSDDRLGDVADAWCRRLLRLGRPGHGLVWLTDDRGHRRVHAYLRVGAMVAPFVAEMVDTTPGPALTRLPVSPSPAELAGLSRAGLRAHVVAVHVAVNYLRYRDELLQGWPALRAATRAWVADTVSVANQRLGPDDPATILITSYGCYLALWDQLRQAPRDTAAVRVAAERLVVCADQVMAAVDAGQVDPGAGTYLLEIANVALAQASAVLDRPVGIERALARQWRACLAARGLGEAADIAARVPELSPAQLFHLLHYASFLAERGERTQLRRALVMAEAVTAVRDEVARTEPAAYTAKHTAARTAHEVTARIAHTLAGRLPDRDRHARLTARAAALRHAVAVLDNATTQRLLLRPDADAAVVSAAAAILPPLVEALHGDPIGVGEYTVRQARALLGSALLHLERSAGSTTSAPSDPAMTAATADPQEAELLALAERFAEAGHLPLRPIDTESQRR